MVCTVMGHTNALAVARVNQYGPSDEVHLSVRVDEKKVRDAGIETSVRGDKAFAMVPTRDGQWKRVDLPFSGSHLDRSGGGPFDNYSIRLSAEQDNVDVDDLRTKGVAFGLEVDRPNVPEPFTVWLQGPDENYKLNSTW